MIALVVLLLSVSSAQATWDYCIVVTKTSDGFLALREGPGTKFKMIAKLMPGFPLLAENIRGNDKWTHIWIEATHGWVYTKYTRPFVCPENDENCKNRCNQE